MQRMHKYRGITLLELMIVVAVVGIISAIAYPSYTEYIKRGHRAEARAGLFQAQQWLERAATAQGVYPTSLPNSLTWKDDSAKRYRIRLDTASTETAFQLHAVPKPGTPQAGDKCGAYTLDHTGKQGNKYLVSGTTTEECWRR